MATVNGEQIQEILTSTGPVVSAVLLRGDGKQVVEEVEIDTSPQKQMVMEILGGPFTFLGQYEDEGIVLMVRRDPDEALALNSHKLQPPFHEAKVQGDILAMKIAQTPEDNFDEEGKVESVECLPNDEFFLNYTKVEYTEFAARTDIVHVPREDIIVEDEDESFDEEDDDEEELSDYDGEEDGDDEEDGSFVDLLMEHVLTRFQQQNGRPPEEHELEALRAAMMEKMGQPVKEDDL